jgi:hypothetical protein
VLFPWLTDDRSRVTAWVGLAKNVGKTTALSEALAELSLHGARPGVLSAGVDGERADAFSGATKPPVCVSEGTLFATARQALPRATAACTVVADTGIRSPLGDVLIAEVTAPGDVFLAGVRRRSELLRARDLLFAHGATHILIDGALDRRAAAAPELVSSVVLATGAVVAPTLDEVVLQTRAVVDRLRLPCVSPDHPLIGPLRQGTVCAQIGRDVVVLDGLRAVADPAQVAAWLREVRRADAGELRSVGIPGLVSDALLRALLPFAEAAGTLVCLDPTRLLAAERWVDRWRRGGGGLAVVAAARVAAVVVNPWAPGGCPIDPERFARQLADALPGVSIVDVRRGRVVLSPHEAP